MATRLSRAAGEVPYQVHGEWDRPPLVGTVEARLRPRPALRGSVVRSELIARLRASTEARVVLLSAAAGSGKTTLLAQWAGSDDRPFAWVSLDPADDDPTTLASDVGRALDVLTLPRPWRRLAAPARPFVLVLDDVHVLRAPACLAALSSIVDHLPGGSQLVLAGRRDPQLPLARWAAAGDLLRLGTRELALTRAEADELLRAAGVQLERRELDLLLRRTEGWATGLHLAALVIGQQPDVAPAEFAGHDQLVADYLREQVLRDLPAETTRFLARTAVLHRFCAPMCDAVLGRRGSNRILRELERSNLFLVPLDRRREWYRYHRLFADALRWELRLQNPTLEAEVHRSASAWHEARGEPGEAIGHARAAGNGARAAGLVWANLLPHLGRDRLDAVRRWVGEFGQAQVAAHPPLAMAAAWCALESGDVVAARRWAAIAEQGDEHAPLPGGPSSIRAAAAILRAAMAQDGVARMAEDAARGLTSGQPASSWDAICRLYQGVAWRLSGEAERARRCLAEAEELARVPLLAAVAVQSLAQLALLALEAGDRQRAAALAGSAARLGHQSRLQGAPATAPVHAAAALLLAHEGRTQESRREARCSARLLEAAAYVPPWLAIDARLALARGCVLVGDAGAALALLREARRTLVRMPDAGLLRERLDQTWRAAEGLRLAGVVGPVPLSTAELRILRFLPTHLSYREIGERLHVSRCTVKSQALSVYRKLDVASRSQAVERARAVGLISEP
ncbi:MAG TPA: LuxR C-terminal-related transcriptional regulator [Candidatus Dormibacteraeota bacterium]|nr:LuxR C-terminal-related transcriptional regulator [Candidatus Dormibacteraeota bacterium]